MTPLLFAAWEKLLPQDFVKVLRIVGILSFRYTIISSLNTNALEPTYHLAAKAVLDAESISPAQIFAILRPTMYVADDVFVENFSRLSIRTNGQRKKLAKYILAKLESDLSGRRVDPDTDPATIEHVLPENPQDSWEQMIPRDRWEENVYRLGNLTLMEATLNRGVGNGEYIIKCAAYAQSTYALTRVLPTFAPQEWTQELILHRQRQLAQRAAHIWRVDYNFEDIS